MKKCNIYKLIFITCLILTISVCVSCDRNPPDPIDNTPSGSLPSGEIQPVILGDLDAPEIIRLGEYDDISTLSFKFNEIENATYYELVVSLNNLMKYSQTLYSTEFTLSPDLITEIGTYNITVTAKADRYNPANGNYKLIVEAGATENLPKLISTPDEFMAINDAPGKFYKLNNDIDFTGIAFVPLCSAKNETFWGDLNGNGYSLKNINLSSNKNDVGSLINIGIFSTLYQARIYDLTIENFSTTSPEKIFVGEERIGVLAGVINDSTVSNVTIKGNINWSSGRNLGNTNYFVGGLAGYITNKAIVTDCNVYSTIELTTYDSSTATTVDSHTTSMFVGGLFGVASLGETIAPTDNILIEKCQTSGSYNVTTNNVSIGGLIGETVIGQPTLYPYQVIVNDCSSSSNLIVNNILGFNETKIKKRIGLLIGSADYIVMNSCFANVNVSKTGFDFDKPPEKNINQTSAKLLKTTYGFIGYNHGDVSGAALSSNAVKARQILNCYYIIDNLIDYDDCFTTVGSWPSTFKQNDIKGVLLKDAITITSLDFVNVWTRDGNNLPVLK